MKASNALATIGSNAIASSTMKAIVQDKYGSSDVLKLVDVDRPVPQDDQVLVRVYASSINAGDWHLMRGTPFLIRLMFGDIAKPKIKTLGSDVTGRVEAVGKQGYFILDIIGRKSLE